MPHRQILHPKDLEVVGNTNVQTIAKDKNPKEKRWNF